MHVDEVFGQGVGPRKQLSGNASVCAANALPICLKQGFEVLPQIVRTDDVVAPRHFQPLPVMREEEVQRGSEALNADLNGLRVVRESFVLRSLELYEEVVGQLLGRQTQAP